MSNHATPRHRRRRATGRLARTATPTTVASSTTASVAVDTDRPPARPAHHRQWPLLAVAATAVGALVGLLLGGHTTSTPAWAPGSTTDVSALATAVPPVAARPVSATQLAALPLATTWGVVPAAPLDPTPAAVPDGELVSPTTTVPVFAAPGGAAIAALPPRQLDGDHQPVTATTVPVIATTAGWVRVLLPSKPNGATGWLPLADHQLHLSTSPYLIRVDRANYTLTLLRAGSVIRHWTVGVGLLRSERGVMQSVTPAGRTFVLADIRILDPTYSPVVLPLGVHSPVFDSYGGGPATVGIHTWTPDSSVYGKPSSHGCVRVPPDALQVLSTSVPIGTPVLIS